ncbi:MAG: N-acetylmuramoyl-L-alanine amidase [Patescibacteria group bacterium]|nr:N-acetylmuramoyl-L-alanine amidase [Patescibacteria group bacterium]MDE2438422.1 N-acetylmuramoyl-L-alanine amidase [Patescibacteria group bacterium]
MKRIGVLCALFLIGVSAIVMARVPRAPSALEIQQEIFAQKHEVASMRTAIPKDSTLRGFYIVVDPGHGDNDPGAIRTLVLEGNKKISIAESAITFDLARRLVWNLARHGASGVYKTLEDPPYSTRNDSYAFWHPCAPPPHMMDLKVLLPSSPYARTDLERILSCRTEVVNQKVRRFGRRHVLFVSVHVDSTAPLTRGIRVYSFYGTHSYLSTSIAYVAKQNKMARVKRRGYEEIIFHSSMKRGYMVIDPRFNRAEDCVLVETGNMRNNIDLHFLSTAQGRERVAEIISEGFIRYCKTQK